MSETKHTPGPWEQCGNEIVGARNTARAWVIAKLAFGTSSSAPDYDYFDSDHRHAQELTEANARLIAAAPDLLEALKLAWAYRFLFEPAPSWPASAIKAALYKATNDETYKDEPGNDRVKAHPVQVEGEAAGADAVREEGQCGTCGYNASKCRCPPSDAAPGPVEPGGTGT